MQCGVGAVADKVDSGPEPEHPGESNIHAPGNEYGTGESTATVDECPAADCTAKGWWRDRDASRARTFDLRPGRPRKEVRPVLFRPEYRCTQSVTLATLHKPVDDTGPRVEHQLIPVPDEVDSGANVHRSPEAKIHAAAADHRSLQ